MRYSFRILFILRKSPSQKDGFSTIQIRVTINGKATEFSSKIKVDPSLWDQKGQKVLGRTKNAQDINNALTKILSRLNKLYDELKEEFGMPTPDKLKEAFFSGNVPNKKYLLLTAFDRLISQRQELAAGNVIKIASANTYVCSKEKIVSYLRTYYSRSDLDIRKVDYEFIKGFEIYLQSKEKCSHNTMVRHMRHLKQATTYAYKNGYLTKDPFYTITLSAKKTERTFLTEEELKKIIRLELADEALRKVRDIFVFQCFSGLSYVDVKQLKHRDIVDETIVIHRQKTGNKSFIPVLQIARILIDKYTTKKDPDISVFPVYVSQRMNVFLKMIGELAGINKTLTTHVGRHTFGTLMLSKGISVESIAKMLGHSELKTTMIYAKILEKKVIEEVRFAEDSLKELTDVFKEQMSKKKKE